MANESIADLKLVQVLSQLTVYDLNRLKKFVQSPYFNANENLSLMLGFVSEAIRKDEVDNLTKVKVWKEIYGTLKFNDEKFRKTCSDLLKLVEKFLAQEVFDNNSLQQADNLLVSIYNRRLEVLYNSALTNATRLSQQYFFRPASYYYHTYSFERNYYNVSGLEIKRTEQANLERIADNLDKFYVAEKLRWFCLMVDRQKVAAHDYRMPFLNEIVQYVEENNLLGSVPINLYYQIHLTQSHPDNRSYFDTLKDLILLHINKLPQVEAFEILDSALNYCIRKVNAGQGGYLREYNELSLMGIQKEILLINGVLSPWTFRNIVFAGLRLKDFEWVRKFIDSYKDLIEDEYRDSAVSFNLANLYLYEKNYSALMELLQKVEYDDPSYNRNSKTMLLLTYYELKEYDSLEFLALSFEQYLRRNKDIPELRKAPYFKLIKFLRALVKTDDTNFAALTRLRVKVESTDSVVNKDWLLEKIDALLEGKKPSPVQHKKSSPQRH